MPVNLDKPQNWKADVAASVDMYNSWFLNFAPSTFRTARIRTTQSVENTMRITNNLRDVNAATLRANPNILPTLRMATCPPIAVDRLIGLAGVSPNLVKAMEEGRMPPRLVAAIADPMLEKITTIIRRMVDPDIFVWLGREDEPSEAEIHRAATIVADRLCGSEANPIIRNEQEKRQLLAIKSWLDAKGYTPLPVNSGLRFDQMPPGTYSFRMNVAVRHEDDRNVNIPIDAVIMPRSQSPGELPIFIEAKSAGDFTNTNKRRKEEAQKMSQLRRTYGNVNFILFLCGYFDSGYLGYEAAEGIDWVWEHRIDDLAQFEL